LKGIVIYDTSYGNTKKIGETIAETLKKSKLDVDFFYVKDVKELRGGDYDFLVIGSPTRIGTMSRAVKKFIDKKIKGEEWANKPFAAYDTEMTSQIEKGGGAAEKIAKKLSTKNLNQILPALKTAVLGIKGPLKEGEIERTKTYAKDLAIKLKSVQKQALKS